MKREHRHDKEEAECAPFGDVGGFYVIIISAQDDIYVYRDILPVRAEFRVCIKDTKLYQRTRLQKFMLCFIGRSTHEYFRVVSPGPAYSGPRA